MSNISIIPRDIITVNVNVFSGDILLTDTYIADVASNSLRKFSKKRNAYSFCPELNHLDKLGFKLCTIFRLNRVKSITVLTKDGSPHSLQIHQMVQEAAEDTNFSKDKISYYVWEKGIIYEVGDRAIRKSRHLNEIQREISLSFLYSLVKVLRGPDGCPNDQKETYESVIEHLKEEVKEIAEAISKKDMQNLEEELGDLLFNIGLLASIAGDHHKISLYTVLEKLNRKMIHKHQKYLRNQEIKY